MGSSYMIRDMDDGNPQSSRWLRRHYVRKVLLIDLHVHFERLAEGGDFHVISVGASTSHFFQVAFKDLVDFFRRRASIITRCRECSSILSFRVSPYSTSRVDSDELFVVGSIITHMLDDARTKLAML